MMQHRDARLARAGALSLTLSLLGSSFACGDDDAIKADAGSDRDSSSDEEDAGQEQDDAGADAGIVEMDAGDGMREVSIRFKAKVGSRDLVCGEHYSGLGTTGITATPQDFRFFVQEVRLVAKGGEEVKVTFDMQPKFQRTDVALLDFTNGMGACAGSGGSVLNTTITGRVPEGDYEGIVFVNGVPEELNHAGPAETAQAPLDDPTLFWSWLSGYRFFIAELLPVATHDAGAADGGMHGDAGTTHGDAGAQGGAAAMHGDAGAQGDAAAMHGSGHGSSEAAFLHVGSSACMGTQATMFSCARAARNEIKLTGFDPNKNYVVADLAEIFKENDLKSPPQCHGIAPQCAAGYAALGIDMNTGEKTSTQRVFRVE